MEKDDPIVQKGDVVYHFTTSIPSTQKADSGHGFLFEWNCVGTVKSVRGGVIHLKASRKEHKHIPLTDINRAERFGLQVSGYASSLILAAQLSGKGKEMIISHIIEQKRLYDELLKASS